MMDIMYYDSIIARSFWIIDAMNAHKYYCIT